MSSVRTHACEYCGDAAYIRVQDLQYHVKAKHPGKPIPYRKSFICDLCGSSFPYQARLNAHKESIHDRGGVENPSSRKKAGSGHISCPFCKSKFARRFSLYKHIKLFHKEFSVPYQRKPKCSICKKLFPTASSLKRHKATHHRQQEDEETFWGDIREEDDDDNEDMETEEDGNQPGTSTGRGSNDIGVSDSSSGTGSTRGTRAIRGTGTGTGTRTGSGSGTIRQSGATGGTGTGASTGIIPETRMGTGTGIIPETRMGTGTGIGAGSGSRAGERVDDDNQYEDYESDDDDDLDCAYCGEQFPTRLELNLHLDEMHDNDERPGTSGIECHFCAQKFNDHNSLAKHTKKAHPVQKMLNPNPNKKFQCPHCHLTFPRAATVRVHVKRKHKEFLEDGDDVGADDGNMDIETDSDLEDDDDVSWINKVLTIDDPDLLYNLHSKPWWSRNVKMKCEQAKIQFRLSRRAIKACDRGFSFEVLRKVLGRILDRYIKGDPQAWIQIKIDSDSLNYPMLSDSSPDLDFVLNAILDQAYRILGSNDCFMIDSILRMEIVYISPNGKTLLSDKLLGHRVSFEQCDGLDEYCQLVRSCWTPITSPPDYGCLGSAIVAGVWIARAEAAGKNPLKQLWYKESELDRNFQSAVDVLYEEAGVSRWEPQTWIDFLQFQKALNRMGGEYGRQIVAYSSRSKDDYFFLGRPFKANQKDRINLAVSKTHVYLIRNLGTFMGKNICMDCSAIYATKDGHISCKLMCPDCKMEHCYKKQKTPGEFSPQPCTLCNRIFHNKYCYNYHHWNGICKNYALCLLCHKVVKRRWGGGHPVLEKHKCSDGLVKCKHCRKEYEPPRSETDKPHYCFVKRPRLQKVGTPKKFYVICFDYETITKRIRNRKRPCYGKRRQYPFLASAVIFCEKCFGETDQWASHCNTPGCGKKQKTWYNRPLAFARWLLYDPERRRNVKTVALSHNGKRFDNFFPLTYLLRSNKKPQLMARGHQIVMMKAGRVIFKDFLSFCPQKLSSLPASFGFADRITKGFYPWRYPNVGNLNEPMRRGLPDRWFYGNDLIKTVAEEEAFESWYLENQHKLFHFKKVGKKYCKGDAEILGRAVQCYTHLGLEISQDKVNPILADGCLTLASFVALVYRACFMPHEYAIGIIPSCGYNTNKNQSVFGLKVLDWMNEKRQEQHQPLIRHKFHGGGEKRLGQFYIDGWIEENREAIQIHGCFYHAHEACSGTGRPGVGSGGKFGDRGMNRIHPLFKIPYKAVAQRSFWKDYNVRNHPDVAKLTVLYECEIRRELSLDPVFKSFWDSRNKMKSYWKSIDARDALFGGLTEAFSLSYKLTKEEIKQGCQIKWVDVVSMYPWVQLTKLFMSIGHPEIFDTRQLKNNGRNWSLETLRSYGPGIASVYIVPPDNLYYPSLPCKVKEHTMFLLCWACGQRNDPNVECDHDDPRERGIVGTYTLKDIEYAMEQGYKLVQVFEVHSYKKMPQTSKLFRRMIKHLIKRKAEASGWAEDVTTPEQRRAFIEYWKNELGIVIDPAAMNENVGMKSLIKLFLVALWGKFAENPRSSVKEYVKSWSRLRSIIFDSRYRVTDLFFEDSSSTYALVCYDKLDQDRPETPLHNVAIGAYVTTYARHALLGYMKQVMYRVLYCDTDGFAYVHRPGMRDPAPLGKALGQLSSELPPMCYIRLFQSLGAKNYRIEIVNTITGEITVIWKAKGIMRTNVVHRNLDEKTYQALIEQRLEHLVEFYKRLGSEDAAVRSEAIQKSIKMFHVLRTIQEVGGGGKMECCLYLPNPSIKRSLKHTLIYNEDSGVKLMRLTAVKRIFPPSVASRNHTSLPIGWKMDRDFKIGLG